MQINTNNNQGGWGRPRVGRGGRNRPPEAQQAPEAGRGAPVHTQAPSQVVCPCREGLGYPPPPAQPRALTGAEGRHRALRWGAGSWGSPHPRPRPSRPGAAQLIAILGGAQEISPEAQAPGAGAPLHALPSPRGGNPQAASFLSEAAAPDMAAAPAASRLEWGRTLRTETRALPCFLPVSSQG